MFPTCRTTAQPQEPCGGQLRPVGAVHVGPGHASVAKVLNQRVADESAVEGAYQNRKFSRRHIRDACEQVKSVQPLLVQPGPAEVLEPGLHVSPTALVPPDDVGEDGDCL